MAKKNTKILIIDSTLRDGNHAVQQQLQEKQIAVYAKAADEAKLPIVVVGHGNGLGASSLQVGESQISDHKMLVTAKKYLKHSQLGVYIIPGFATIHKNLSQAIDDGVDVFCIGCHCTEADTTRRHMEYITHKSKIAYGNLMMTHMITAKELIEECKKMESYGAKGIILMDSAGAYLPHETSQKIRALVSAISVPIGFHAHNNLELAVANSIAAVEAGATILDACARGFGAGAGNTSLEVLVAVLHKLGYSTGIDLYKIFDASDVAEKELMQSPQVTKPISIVSGLAGVFSGFAKHVMRISEQFGVDPRDVFFELGKRKVVAGQEDTIVETAIYLSQKGKKGS